MAKKTDGNGKSPEAGQKQNVEQPILPAVFFNHMVIRHSAEEVYFDIGQLIPGTQLAGMTHRFITTTAHAKRILEALRSNLKKYEAQYGRISQPKPKAEKKKRVTKNGSR